MKWLSQVHVHTCTCTCTFVYYYLYVSTCTYVHVTCVGAKFNINQSLKIDYKHVHMYTCTKH